MDFVSPTHRLSNSNNGNIPFRNATTNNVGRIVELGADSEVIKVGNLVTRWRIEDPPVPALIRLVLPTVGT